jgi:hypothetical protein
MTDTVEAHPRPRNHPKNYRDITGERFDRLVAVRSDLGLPEKWLFRCDCGSMHIAIKSNVTTRRTRSCGCLASETAIRRNTTHGMSRTPEYHIWHSLRRRGKVCKEWKTLTDFLADMGTRPSPAHNLERLSADKLFSADNCHWMTKAERARAGLRGVPLTVGNETHSIAAWARRLGCSRQVVQARLGHGWSPEEAVTTPLHAPRLSLQQAGV